MKLTPQQSKALARLSRTEWESAYSSQSTLRTLDALSARGLVEVCRDLGSMFSPRTHTRYRLTEAGVAARAVSYTSE